MACRGAHFAIERKTARWLLAAADDDELVAVVDELEEQWDRDHLFETDKAWDALHRCLSDGTLDPEAGEPPLNQCFFGGRMLNQEDEYFVVLLTPAAVKRVATALEAVTEAWLRERYFDLEFPDYDGEKEEEDFRSAWSSFVGLPAFFARAAEEKRYVVFTVDQ